MAYLSAPGRFAQIAQGVGAISASGLPASRLELEITEAVLIRDDAALAIFMSCGPSACGSR